LRLKILYTKKHYVHHKGIQRVKTILPDTYYSARMKKDGVFLTKAIKIASKGISEGGGPFGAIIVKDDKIIAEAYNRVVLNKDPAALAEKAGFSDKLIYNEIMLDPPERKISFIRLTDFGGNEIFREWDELENKIIY
jgi:hypothetical protein